MFPDCPAQPANILRARYPRSRAGERKPPRGRLLTLAEELPPPGSPRPAESSPAGPGSQILRSPRRGAKGAISFALRGETGEGASSAWLGLWELSGCGANPVS